ncbi:MAG: GDP-mannose 4,6-dehydratase [Pseudomonadales bacterium]|nr:GDP-mannose 4,6-dehydratase [Pseudomonadales bacterium]
MENLSNNYFNGKTILLTGGAGFIGSSLTKRLLSFGSKVISVDNFISGRKENLVDLLDSNLVSKVENLTFIQADVSQPVVNYLPENVHLDLVLHFASPASPPRYQAKPVETYLVNSIATHYLLDFLINNNPDARFLFAGTSEVYGDPLEHPQKESYWGNVNPNGERSCYDESKRLGETICGVFSRSFRMDTRIVRIFNTYGPNMDPADGRVIPNLITQALKDQPFTIYGNGSQTRSYCYIDDLCEFILRFAAKEGLAGETINIGNPDEFSIIDTAKIISKLVLGHESEINIENKTLPSDDPTRRQPDISKAKTLLEFEPQVNFEAGLKLTIEYFRNLI